MLDASSRSLGPAPLARAARRRRARGIRRLQLSAPADRRGAGHHQRPGADQHRGARLFAARGGAAHHLPDRDRDGGPAAARLHALACRATGCRRSPSCSRTAPTSISRASCVDERLQEARTAAAGPRARAGPDRDGPRRDLHVHGRGRARRATPRRRSLRHRRICARSRTGSSGRSSRNVPGVTEVNTIGGYERQYHVTPRPDALLALRPDAGGRGRQRWSATTPTSAPATSSAAASSTWCACPGQVGTLDEIRAIVRRDARRHARSASATSPRSRSARSCAPARPPRTARKWCSARSSC